MRQFLKFQLIVFFVDDCVGTVRWRKTERYQQDILGEKIPPNFF